MVKIPKRLILLGSDLATAYGTAIAASLVRKAASPETTEKTLHFIEKLRSAARSRTLAGKVRGTINALRAQLTLLEVNDDDDRYLVESWRQRVRALDATLDLVDHGYHGRERTRQLKRLKVQTDALLGELIAHEDEIVSGKRFLG